MSDHGAKVACISTGYIGAPVKSTQGSSYGDPPPYSVSIPYLPAANSSSPGTHSSIPVSPSVYPANGIHHQGYVTGNILHNTTSGATFPDVTRRLENPGDEYVPRPVSYNSQLFRNPSCTAQRQNDPPPNVHGRQTIVLQRTETENIARRRQKTIALLIILLISCVVPIAIISIFLANYAKFPQM